MGGDGMTKRTWAVGMVTVAVLAGGGALLASNMGFKLNYQLLRATAGTSANGTNTLALPFNPQVGITSSKTLMDDVGSASVGSVQRYMKPTNTFELYTGRAGTPNANFTLATGEGYLVVMNTTTNYIVVGSHNPSASITLNRATAGVSATGNNLFSFPYHHTANTSKALMDDIGSASVGSIQRYMRPTNTFEVYTGRAGTPNANFTVALGEAYFIVMNTTTNYVPSHY
jgi:hypothetical protein